MELYTDLHELSQLTRQPPPDQLQFSTSDKDDLQSILYVAYELGVRSIQQSFGTILWTIFGSISSIIGEHLDHKTFIVCTKKKKLWCELIYLRIFSCTITRI